MAVVRILNVVLDPAGDSLDEDHVAGATTISVADASEFLDEFGNTCEIDDVIYTIGVSISTDEADQVDIDPPLVADARAGTRVNLQPPTDQKKAYFVYVEDEEDQKMALVSMEMDAFLETGVRAPEEAELAEVEEDDGNFYIVRVLNKSPYITPEILPPADYLRTDEVPPDVPTNVTLLPAINSLFVQFPPVPNREVVTYEIYASTNSGVTQNAAFYVGEAKGNRFTIYEVFNPVEQKMVPLKSGMDVYVAVAAKDSDGSSALSAEVKGQPIGVVGPDIASGSVVARHILGNEVTADKFAASLAMISEIQMGARMTLKPSGEKSGLYIELNEVNGQKGAIHLPADGSRARVDAGINAKGLLSEYNFVMQGNGNRLQSGLMMAAGVKPPSEAPSVVPYYNVAQNVRMPDGSIPQSLRGMHWDGSLFGGGGGWWTTRRDAVGRNYVSCVAWSNGLLYDQFAISAAYSNVYATGVGRGDDGNVYVLTQNNENQNWMLYRFTTTGTQLANRSVGNVNDFVSMALCVNNGFVHWAAHRASDNKIGVSRTNESTASMATHSATISTNTTAGIGAAFYIGSADVGATRVWIAEDVAGGGFYRCYIPNFGSTPGNMTRDGQFDFSFARGAFPSGLMFPGGRFYSFEYSAGVVYNYSVIATATTVSVGYTFFDSNPTGGQHETTLGPQVSVTLSRRAFHRVTCAAPPNNGGADDPDSVRIYVNNNRQADLGSGVISAGYDSFPNGTTSPGSNGFAGIPNASGYLYSELSDASGSKINLQGGSPNGRIGPVQFNDTIVNMALASTGVVMPGNQSRYLRGVGFGYAEVTIPNGSRTGVLTTIQHGMASTPEAVIANAFGTATDITAKCSNRDSVYVSITAQRTGTSGAQVIPVMWCAFN